MVSWTLGQRVSAPWPTPFGTRGGLPKDHTLLNMTEILPIVHVSIAVLKLYLYVPLYDSFPAVCDGRRRSNSKRQVCMRDFYGTDIRASDDSERWRMI